MDLNLRQGSIASSFRTQSLDSCFLDLVNWFATSFCIALFCCWKQIHTFCWLDACFLGQKLNPFQWSHHLYQQPHFHVTWPLLIWTIQAVLLFDFLTLSSRIVEVLYWILTLLIGYAHGSWLVFGMRWRCCDLEIWIFCSSQWSLLTTWQCPYHRMSQLHCCYQSHCPFPMSPL